MVHGRSKTSAVAIRSRRADDAGATLVELLVVLLVLGVLAVIALNGLGSGQSSGKGSGRVSGQGSGQGAADRGAIAAAERQVCVASADAIRTAALAYYAGHAGVWPPDVAALVDATPPYLKSLPDPKWGLVYDNTTGQVDAKGCGKL